MDSTSDDNALSLGTQFESHQALERAVSNALLGLRQLLHFQLAAHVLRPLISILTPELPALVILERIRHTAVIGMGALFHSQ